MLGRGSMTKSAQEAVSEIPDRPLRFVSAMETLDELVELFSHTVDEKTIFIATKLTVPVGQQRRFLITLKSGQPVLCGHAEVCESPARLAGPGSPTGIRLRMLRLTRDSATVHARVLDLRSERAAAAAQARPLPPPPPPPVRKTSADGVPSAVDEPDDDEETDVAKGVDPAPPPPQGERVPPSPFVLPANPLSELSDKNLHGLIECAMYEDTGTAPRAEPDDMVGLAPRSGDTMVRRFDERSVDLEALAALVDRIAPAVEARLAPVVEARLAPAVEAAAAPAPAPPPPPTIIEVPGPPVKVSVGFASQALIAVLGIVVGGAAVYAILELELFGRRSSSSPPEAPVAAAEPTAAPAVDAAPVPPPVVAPSVDAAPEAAVAAPDAGVAAPDAGVAPPDPGAAGDGTCTATIEAPTERATVLVDGKRIGHAPIRDLAVPCDRALTIEIDHPRYQPYRTSGVARPGAPLVVRAALERPRARLRLTSAPSGAIMTVDGKVVGRAPIEIEVTAYTNISVTGTLDGYQTWKRRVRVPAKGSTVHLKLAGRAAAQ
jgi:hypothetical protein